MAGPHSRKTFCARATSLPANSGRIILHCISDNQSESPFNWSFPEPLFSSSMRRKKLAGSGNEIAGLLFFVLFSHTLLFCRLLPAFIFLHQSKLCVLEIQISQTSLPGVQRDYSKGENYNILVVLTSEDETQGL